jgi:para-nitrobenzyl esterase
MQSQKGSAKAFVYYFDHRTPSSPDGANHGDEVSYVFQNFRSPGGTPGAEDLALSDMIRSYWINFAATGNPNGPGLPNWPEFTEKDQRVFIFDKNSGAKPIPNLEKLKAYDSYYSWRREQARKYSAK